MRPPEQHPLMIVGRLLPRTLRTRVFEPAVHDLISEVDTWREGGVLERTRCWLRVLFIAAETLRVGGPRLLWESQRRSWRLRVAAVVLVVLLIALVLLKTYAPVYPDAYLPGASP